MKLTYSLLSLSTRCLEVCLTGRSCSVQQGVPSPVGLEDCLAKTTGTTHSWRTFRILYGLQKLYATRKLLVIGRSGGLINLDSSA